MTKSLLQSLQFSTLAKELTASTRVMQSSSDELRTPVSNSAKCKQKKANKYVI